MQIKDLIDQFKRKVEDEQHIALIKRYIKGDHNAPYTPGKRPEREYRHLAENSIMNMLPLVVDSYVNNLYVSGFTSSYDSENLPVFNYWLNNKLQVNQSIIYRSALEYGESYIVINNGNIFAVPATRILTLYDLIDDTYPRYALILLSKTLLEEQEQGNSLQDKQVEIYQYYDSEKTETIRVDEKGIHSIHKEEHLYGITPIIRFKTSTADTSEGIIKPLIPLQNAINDVSFNISIVDQFASFRQKYLIGQEVPRDLNDIPVNSYEVSADRIFIAEDPNAKFGDFPQSSTQDMQNTLKDRISTLAVASHLPVHIFAGVKSNVNISDAEMPFVRQLTKYQQLFENSWIDMFMLLDSSVEANSHISWEDSTFRSLSKFADAMSKIIPALGIPKKGMWPWIPGATPKMLEEWKKMDKEESIYNAILNDDNEDGSSGESTEAISGKSDKVEQTNH